jgi:hypothetical protein
VYDKINKLVTDRDRKRDEGIAREEAARVAKVLESASVDLKNAQKALTDLENTLAYQLSRETRLEGDKLARV